MQFFLELLPVIVIIFTALILKRIHGTWLAPSSFFSLFWGVFTCAPLIFAKEFNFYPLGLWIITSVVLAIGLGSLLAKNDVNDFMSNKYKYDEYNYNFDRVLLTSMIIFSLIACLGVLQLFQFGMDRFELNLSLSNLLLLANNFSVDRYNEILSFPWRVKGLLYFLFPAALVGGIYFGKTTGKYSLVAVLPLIIAILKGTIDTTRFTFILAIVLWLSGYFGARVLFHKKLQNLFDKKTTLIMLTAGSIFLLIFIGFQWLRQMGGILLADLMIDRMKVYFFGYLSAFSNWSANYELDKITFGASTFAGPANLLGLLQRESGFYDFIPLMNLQYTNIFTAFRGIFQDFTLVGGLILLTCVGFWVTIAFNRVFSGNKLFLFPLTIFYAFTMYSPIISIFLYNSIIMAWIITFGIIILFVREKAESP
jgi:oligosaccharide repeat unit polymerase